MTVFAQKEHIFTYVKKNEENYLPEAKRVLRETMALALSSACKIKKSFLFVVTGCPHQLEPYFVTFFAYF